MINDQIYITSVAKAVILAKKTGKLNLKNLQIFNLLRYYIDFTNEIIATGDDTFVLHNKILKEKIAKLKYKYPSEICNYKTVVANTQELYVAPTNIAPTVSNNTIDILNNMLYQFKVGDFLVNFNDINNDSYKYLLIYPLSDTSAGTLTDTEVPTNNIEAPVVIDIEGLSENNLLNLYFNRTHTGLFSLANFKFRVSDNAENYLYSGTQVFYINATLSSEVNLPPSDIGDNTIFVDNREVTVLTLNMFTSDLILPYSDPESDLIDAIRIIDISNANKGTYIVNGIPIVEGQIITREEINAGLFTHNAPDVDDISSDTFQFQARDEGSKIWID